MSTSTGPEYYVNVLSIVDKAQLEPGCTVLLHNKALSVVGVLSDEADPMVSVMKARQICTLRTSRAAKKVPISTVVTGTARWGAESL